MSTLIFKAFVLALSISPVRTQLQEEGPKQVHSSSAVTVTSPPIPPHPKKEVDVQSLYVQYWDQHCKIAHASSCSSQKQLCANLDDPANWWMKRNCAQYCHHQRCQERKLHCRNLEDPTNLWMRENCLDYCTEEALNFEDIYKAHHGCAGYDHFCESGANHPWVTCFCRARCSLVDTKHKCKTYRVPEITCHKMNASLAWIEAHCTPDQKNQAIWSMAKCNLN